MEILTLCTMALFENDKTDVQNETSRELRQTLSQKFKTTLQFGLHIVCTKSSSGPYTVETPSRLGLHLTSIPQQQTRSEWLVHKTLSNWVHFMRQGWSTCVSACIMLRDCVLGQYKVCIIDLHRLGINMGSVYYCAMRTSHLDLACFFFAPALSTFLFENIIPFIAQ